MHNAVRGIKRHFGDKSFTRLMQDVASSLKSLAKRKSPTTNSSMFSNFLYVLPIIFTCILYVADVSSDLLLAYGDLHDENPNTQMFGGQILLPIILPWVCNIWSALRAYLKHKSWEYGLELMAAFFNFRLLRAVYEKCFQKNEKRAERLRERAARARFYEAVLEAMPQASMQISKCFTQPRIRGVWGWARRVCSASGIFSGLETLSVIEKREQTNRQTNKHTDKQIDRQTNKQTNKQTNTRTHSL